MSSLKLLPKIFGLAVFVLLANIMIAPNTSAINTGYGYFGGDRQQSADGNTVLYTNNHQYEAIPDYVTDVNSLVSFLKARYNSGLEQDKIGAAFIVDTFLNKGEGSNNPTVSSTDWTDFQKKFQSYESAGLVTWDRSKLYSLSTDFNNINSLYSPGIKDDVYYKDTSGKMVTAIYLKNADGTFAYAIKYDCANPVGSPNMKDVQITPTINVTPESVLPGQVITWDHGVILAGTGKTSSLKIQYRQYTSETSSTVAGTGSAIDLGAQQAYYAYATNTSKPDYSKYTATAADVGKTFCRSTFVTAVINGVTTTYESERACATVGSNIAGGTCRPIVISAQDPNWSGTKGTSYKTRVPGGSNAGGETVNVTVKIYKLDNNGNTVGGAVFTKTVLNGASINDVGLTTTCTSGDKYKVTFNTSSYTYNVTSVYHPDTHNCGKYHNKACGNAYTTYTGHTRTDAWSQQIGPCYDYTLSPSINSLSNYQVEVGASISITPTIGNASWTKTNLINFWNTYRTSTKSKPTEWQISRLKVNPGKSIPTLTMTTSTKSACDYYKSKGFDNCASEKAGTGVVFSNNSTPASVISGTSPLQSLAATVGDEPAGTKICFAFSVKSANSESSNESASPSNLWYNSATAKINCVIVVKKPKVQVLGGDIKTGRSFDGVNPIVQRLNILTLNSVKSVGGQLKTFGSWAEYGLFASGTIRGMASGSAFNGGIAATSSGTPQSNYSTLSFSNSGSTGVCGASTNGCYSYGKATIPDISASYPASTATKTLSGSVNLSSLTTSGVYKYSNHLSITGGTIPKGRWIIINASDSNGTVVIDGDINYDTAKVTNINDIPQLVIIAKNIEIADDVSNVDAWLIAKGGYLNTCETHRTTKLSISDCNVRLTINGPVMASTLYLRRTAGSGTTSSSNDPSEIFNLRADAYLWAYARSTGSGRVWTVYTTNVPARL